MTGPEAIDHYSKAVNATRLALARFEEAPGSQSPGTGGSSCSHLLGCAKTQLEEALQHVKKLLKK